ncbi:MAG: hypothetical protein V3R66_05175, partial [Rhodospirillales bacterium]
VRAFLFLADHESADVWFGLLSSSAMFDRQAGLDLKALMPLARLSDSPQAAGWSSDDLDGWWNLNKDREEIRDRASLLFSIFDAIGEDVPDVSWEALIEGPARTIVAMPHPALWYRLESASRTGSQGEGPRLGETVLLSLIALGEGGPGEADPVVLRRVLKSLIAAGLEAESRALAMEAAVAAGL